MKIALIGTGKTGSAFFDCATSKHEVITFSRRNPVSAEGLKDVDAAVVFVPATGLSDLVPMLLASGKPVVCGTSGFALEALPAPKAPWIVASNFSVGMNIAFLMAKILARQGSAFRIHEVHHTTKVDSPSGTALHLASLLPEGTAITADRVGDARGLHRLEVDLPGETLTVQHEAHNRTVFGAGALHAVEGMLPSLQPGIHKFETLIEKNLKEELFHA